MRFPCFLLLLSVVMASSHSTTTNDLTTYWSSRFRGIPMPSAIEDCLQTINIKWSSTQFVANNPNITEFVNIYQCHPPGLTAMKMDSTSSISMHFLEKDLSTNSNVNLYPKFLLNAGKAHFIPRSIVEKRYPTLEATNLPTILSRFSISLNSTASKVIKHTVELCEYAAKDDNSCVTSLEGMVDSVESTLGKSNNNNNHGVIRAYSTTIGANYFGSKIGVQPYRIVQVKRVSNVGDTKSTVTCHKAEFPFAVFLCHQRPTTVPYMVTLEGVYDKTRIQAATACHMDTSSWDPLFPGLVALKATPGTPVCHFLNQGSMLWVRAVAP